MLQAYSKLELLSFLKKIDVSLPNSSGRCIKERKEQYDIAHLLSTLAAEDQLSYPLCLIRRERPDFLLTLGTMQIGIEITEAIHQDEAHKDKLLKDINQFLDAAPACCESIEKLLVHTNNSIQLCFMMILYNEMSKDYIKNKGPYYISSEKFEKSKKSVDQLLEEIIDNPPGRGWEGDSLKREWSDIMFHFVEKKAANLQKDGFDKFEQNWLLIYNNSNCHLIDKPSKIKAAEFLRKKIDNKKKLNKFDRIYILSDSQLLELSSERTQFYPINNLWKRD